MENNGAEELIRYVLEYHTSFMTEREREAIRIVSLEEKAEATADPAMASMLRKLARRNDADLADQVRQTGLFDYRRNIANRLLRDHVAEIVVNHCPACRRIARTPKARQCFRCGHYWH